MAANTDPHYVVAICDRATEEILQYRATPQQDDGSHNAKFDPETQVVKIVGEAENYAAAVRLQKKLEAWTPKSMAADPHDLGVFDERMPENPKARAAAYRSLPEDVQEAVVYSILCSTGLPLKRVASWLCVKPDEVSKVVSEEVAAAARAELDLRIAKKMVQFAMLNKSPAAMSAALFLTKVFLKWNENGMGEENPQDNRDATQSLFEKLTVVDTHRDEQGQTIKEPTHLALVKKA